MQNTRIFWTGSRTITLAGGQSGHVSATWSAIWSSAMAFWVKIRKGPHRPCAFQHSDFNSNMRRASRPSVFASFFWTILAFAWPHFCSLGLVGLLALALVRKRAEKSSGKVQDVTENWAGESGVGWSPLCQKCKSSRRLWAGNGRAESVERTLLHESGPMNRYTLGHRQWWNPREVYSRVNGKENLKASWVWWSRKLFQT